MEEVSNAKHYIAVNAGGRYPLLKTAQDYTEYFHEALSFSDLYETYRYIEKHGLEKNRNRHYPNDLTALFAVFYFMAYAKAIYFRRPTNTKRALLNS